MWNLMNTEDSDIQLWPMYSDIFVLSQNLQDQLSAHID